MTKAPAAQAPGVVTAGLRREVDRVNRRAFDAQAAAFAASVAEIVAADDRVQRVRSLEVLASR